MTNRDILLQLVGNIELAFGCGPTETELTIKRIRDLLPWPGLSRTYELAKQTLVNGTANNKQRDGIILFALRYLQENFNAEVREAMHKSLHFEGIYDVPSATDIDDLCGQVETDELIKKPHAELKLYSEENQKPEEL